MNPSKTPSFVLELPLRTTPVQESTILVCLDTGRQLYNACLGEGLRRLALIQQSKDFQEILKLPKTIDGELNKERTKVFNELNKNKDFTQYALHLMIKEIWFTKKEV